MKLWQIGIGIYSWAKYQQIDSWQMYLRTIRKLFANRELFAEHCIPNVEKNGRISPPLTIWSTSFLAVWITTEASSLVSSSHLECITLYQHNLRTNHEFFKSLAIIKVLTSCNMSKSKVCSLNCLGWRKFKLDKVALPIADQFQSNHPEIFVTF